MQKKALKWPSILRTNPQQLANPPKKPVPANPDEQVSQGQDRASRAKASHAALSGSADGGA